MTLYHHHLLTFTHYHYHEIRIQKSTHSKMNAPIKDTIPTDVLGAKSLYRKIH